MDYPIFIIFCRYELGMCNNMPAKFKPDFKVLRARYGDLNARDKKRDFQAAN